MALFMVRYGEIALKSPRIRSRFEKMLVSNLTSRFVSAGMECRIDSERGRIFLWADDEDFARHALLRTFGIVSFSKVVDTAAEKEDIFSLAVEMSKPLFRKGTRFCIRVRRSGQHDYTSMELARDAGSAVFLANEHMEPKVDLTNPELEIFVDVRQNRAYLYTESMPGTGGMPLGTQGRVLGLVERKRDIAACWLLMKRGCRVIIATKEPALAKPLEPWDPELKMHNLDGSEDLAQIARKRRSDGLCLGWSMGDFDAHSAEMEGLDVPIFYPLMGMTDAEIDALIARIDG